jgi:hypothetical protein
MSIRHESVSGFCRGRDLKFILDIVAWPHENGHDLSLALESVGSILAYNGVLASPYDIH